MAIIGIALIGVWGISLGLTLLSVVVGMEHFNQKRKSKDIPYNLLPISIIKPIKGIQDGTDICLKSFFNLDYPKYELLISIANPFDPVRPLVEHLMAKHPHVKARLIIGEEPVGPNPKVRNMMKSYRECQHDWVLITDSNAWVDPFYLKRMASYIENNVGVVTAIIAGKEASNVSGYLEEVSMNTFYPKGLLLAKWGGHPCALGKSLLFEKKSAERFGGLKVLAQYLHEDFMMGHAIHQLGLDVILMKEPVYQYVGSYSLKAYWKRHVRWGCIRKNQAPLAYAFEPFLNSIIPGAIGFLGFSLLGGREGVTFLLFHFALWFLSDFYFLAKLSRKFHVMLPLLWGFKEGMFILIWLSSWWGNKIEWHGLTFNVRIGGLLEKS